MEQHLRPECSQNEDYDDKGRYSCPEHAAERISVETYTSTSPSIDVLDDDLPPFDVPDYRYDAPLRTAKASTAREFAQYFPSTNRVSIQHDDGTDDGNMNLRIDTVASTSDGGKVDLTLFHLRMYDLKRRDFSLRRYCRDSGKEVCRSNRKYTKPSVIRRPALQSSMSNALSNLRSKSENKTFTVRTLKRQDSGYESMSEENHEGKIEPQQSQRPHNVQRPSDTIMLEFSNYAHLGISRRGTKSSKRYDFDYWGTKYAWKRAILQSGSFNEVSYHLVDVASSMAVAHIVPVPLSNVEVQEEEAKGGWVPPCSMWISDETILEKPSDVADVIMASGLIALVDDCIKRRWHQKTHMQLTIPSLPRSLSKMDMDCVGPKRLIDEVFNRRVKQASRHPTPLRQSTI
ncbi:MAG: hypothetical protein Q9217_003078 [Psora testacea]